MEESCKEGNSSQLQESHPKPKEPRGEPITVKSTANFNDMLRLENEIVKTQIKKIYKLDSVKLYPETIDHYRSIQNFLTETSMKYYAMLPKNERLKKVLLKGISPGTNIEDIKTELSKKFKIHRVS